MKLAIIDQNSVYARSYFASQSESELMAEEPSIQEVVNLATHFALSLLDPTSSRIGQKFDAILMAYDDGQKRDKGRAPKPPIYHDAMAAFRSTFGALIGGATVSVPGYEADDVVATAAYRVPYSDEVYVVSGDKDLLQLVGSNIQYFDLRTKQLVSRTAILERWHVKRPCQVALALAVLGDPIDKVPGVHGLGPKKVAKMFELVTPDMNFNEALAAIESQLPAESVDVFYESLDLTLLDAKVPGVPAPAPLRFTSFEEASKLISGRALMLWQELAEIYAKTG